VDAHETEKSTQADDGSKQNVEVCGQSWFDLGTRDIARYYVEDGDDVHVEEEASQADD